MRVIAGSARGIRLQAPPGREVRPTGDRVRESLFNILGQRLDGLDFLDLYAGTGANGIEALSRGARRAVFVESNREAAEFLMKNCRAARVWDHSALVRAELPASLAKLPGTFDVIFADPPYTHNTHAEILEEVQAHGLLAPQGVVVLEHERKVDLPEIQGNLKRYRHALYGGTALSFYS